MRLSLPKVWAQFGPAPENTIQASSVQWVIWPNFAARHSDVPTCPVHSPHAESPTYVAAHSAP